MLASMNRYGTAMDSSNPYEAPQAELRGVSAGSEGELANAVAPFVASYRHLRILAVLCGLGALASSCGMVATRASTPVPTGQLVAMFAVITGGYLVAAVLFFRMAGIMRALVKEPTLVKVAAVLNRLTQTWVVGLGVLIFMFAGSWAQRLTTASAVTPALWTLDPQEGVVGAAVRLRRVLVVVVVAAVLIMIAGVGGVFLTSAPPTPGVSQGMLRAITLGSGIVQLALLWLVWRQVPALEGFIARPSAASLKAVATAHAVIWRVVVWGIGLIFLLGVVAAVALPILFTGPRLAP